MKAIAEYLTRLKAAHGGALAVTEADVLREVQADAFQEGYAKAARDLLGIALESEGRTDAFLGRAQSAGLIAGSRLAF